MSLNRELLKNIFDDMGYEVEFDSTTPGLCVEELIVEWTSDLCLNDIEEPKIKTSSIKKLPITESLSARSYTSNYNSKSSQSILYSDSWGLVA
ncbi:TPA: hypothetical protein ACJI8N_001926 [Enterococcus hirae]